MMTATLSRPDLVRVGAVFIVLVLLGLSGCTTPCPADLVIRSGPTYIRDTWIDNAAEFTYFNQEDTCSVQSPDKSDKHALINFRDMGLPAGAVVDSAQFWVSMHRYPVNGLAYTPHRTVLNPLYDECTWRLYRMSQYWNNHGCMDNELDYDGSNPLMSETAWPTSSPGDSVKLFHGATFSTEVANRHQGPWSVVLIDAGTILADLVTFYATDHSTAALRPRLWIWYTVPPAADTQPNQGWRRWW